MDRWHIEMVLVYEIQKWQEKRATKALHGKIYNNTLIKKIKNESFLTFTKYTLYEAEVWPVTSTKRNKIRTVELDFEKMSDYKSPERTE